MQPFLVTLVSAPLLMIANLLSSQHYVAASLPCSVCPFAHSPLWQRPNFPLSLPLQSHISSAASGNDSPGENEDIQWELPSLEFAHQRRVSILAFLSSPLLLPLTVSSPVRHTARVSLGLCVGPCLGTSLSSGFS